jgi:hypothetical protein
VRRLGRLHEVGHKLRRPAGHGLGVARRCSGQTVEFDEADDRVGDGLAAPDLLGPGLRRVREEGAMAVQIAPFDDRAGLLRSAQLAHPNEREVAPRGQPLDGRCVSLVGAGQERDLGRKSGIDEGFAFEQFVGRHVDPHHKLEPKDGLTQGTANGGQDDLGPLAVRGVAGSPSSLPGQAIEWSLRWVLGDQRGDV